LVSSHLDFEKSLDIFTDGMLFAQIGKVNHGLVSNKVKTVDVVMFLTVSIIATGFCCFMPIPHYFVVETISFSVLSAV
jgi:hypothetical protein